jgi:phage terminase large subunit GpA-like protein
MRKGSYKALKQALNDALKRASEGKGYERHAENKPFHQQDICTELRAFGQAPASYQIRKKAKEALRLSTHQAANEFLDVIVYAAAAYITLKEKEAQERNDQTE